MFQHSENTRMKNISIERKHQSKKYFNKAKTLEREMFQQNTKCKEQIATNKVLQQSTQKMQKKLQNDVQNTNKTTNTNNKVQTQKHKQQNRNH